MAKNGPNPKSDPKWPNVAQILKVAQSRQNWPKFVQTLQENLDGPKKPKVPGIHHSWHWNFGNSPKPKGQFQWPCLRWREGRRRNHVHFNATGDISAGIANTNSVHTNVDIFFSKFQILNRGKSILLNIYRFGSFSLYKGTLWIVCRLFTGRSSQWPQWDTVTSTRRPGLASWYVGPHPCLCPSHLKNIEEHSSGELYHIRNGPKAFSTLTHSTPLVEGWRKSSHARVTSINSQHQEKLTGGRTDTTRQLSDLGLIL